MRHAAETHRQTRLEIPKINDPRNRNRVAPHSTGEAVIRAAVLLDRIKFSPGEISKNYNNNLRHTIQAFQSVKGLPMTGDMDLRTWDLLNEAAGQLSGEIPVGGRRPGEVTSAARTSVGAISNRWNCRANHLKRKR